MKILRLVIMNQRTRFVILWIRQTLMTGEPDRVLGRFMISMIRMNINIIRGGGRVVDMVIGWVIVLVMRVIRGIRCIL